MLLHKKYFLFPLLLLAHLAYPADQSDAAQDSEQKELVSPVISAQDKLNYDLGSAVMNIEPEKVKSLIQQKADVNHLDKDFGKSCLLATANEKVATILLENKADPNLIIQGQPTLHWAVGCEVGRRPQIVKLLLKHGAKVNEQDSEGMTPLHRVRHLEYARLLLEHKANPTAVTPAGNTPLHAMAYPDREWSKWNDPEVIQHLIEAKVAVDAQNNEGKTALLLACEQQNKKCVKTLLKAKADLFVKDKSGKTPFKIAFKNMQPTEK